MAEETSPKLAKVSDVEIDANGRFKYILIKVIDKSQGGVFKYIVRGHDWADFHADIYDRVESEIQQMGLMSDCVGGGRIQHDKIDKKILVYGYSMGFRPIFYRQKAVFLETSGRHIHVNAEGFGLADHSITVEKLKKAYPDYTSITFSNEGY